ncbi:MAG: Polysaccharide biosynthesis protein [Chloroflexi bacterium]|nr:Polysaccharide biosynthesis protein [Chloroflexota bacterium]
MESPGGIASVHARPRAVPYHGMTDDRVPARAPAWAEVVTGRRILVTGGSGTIGARLVDRLLEHAPEVVRVFGRDETKQFYQRQRHQTREDLRFLVGDIRDRDRLTRALEGIDVVFHCAALKHVESGEYNPFEASQTNVVGTQNVIDACLATGVRTMVFTSSDKAANPTSVMGASKLLAEKIVTAATNYRGHHGTTFASVRFGNVLGSRGSAVELFATQVAGGGPVTVTDPEMTRFVMSTDRAVELAVEAARIARGGEVFVFKMPAARLRDLVSAAIAVYAPRHGLDAASISVVRIPVRPGEKAYEELMTEDESTRARDLGPMYAVLPAIRTGSELDAAYSGVPGAPVGPYRSDAEVPLATDEVERLVRDAVDGLEP